MSPPPTDDDGAEPSEGDDGTGPSEGDDGTGPSEVDHEAATADGDDAGVTPADAFGALSDPLRVKILRELSAHRNEARGDDPFDPVDPAGFAELRRRVGVRDSGRFRYHLEELRDHFVEKTDDGPGQGGSGERGGSSGGGYRLTHAGMGVVAAVLAGTYTDEASVGPAGLDSDCPICGEPAVAAYGDGVCRVTCGGGHLLFTWDLPPRAAAGAAPATVVERAELLAVQGIERSLAGVCPKCYGAIETAVVDAERPVLGATCETCGCRLAGPVGFCLLVDPEVAAFYRRRGRPLDEHHVWELSFVHEEAATVVETDPVRVRIEASLDGETLAATVDEAGHVVTVDRPASGGERSSS